MSENLATTQTTPPAEQINEMPTFAPATDIFETEEAVIMLLEMPGADPATLNVTLDNRILEISARSIAFKPEGYTLRYSEYQEGNYERGFTLSELIDVDRIEAVFKDGVLRLTLPKASPSSARKIAVKAE
jgi:HSP20 family molecular chaperone IbpA